MMDSPRTLILTSLTAVAVVIVIGIYLKAFRKSHHQSKMKPRIKNWEEVKEMKWESVGKVVKVMIYPIKSCAGEVVRSAQAEPLGLVNGTVRDSVWGATVQGLDCGEDVSRWLQRILGPKCFLLYHANLPSTRTTELPNGEKYPLLRNDDHPLYADFSGHMLMTKESIADLQNRVDRQIAAEDFRPNILIDGTRGPYDEDEWEYIMIGDAVFRNAKPCTRCIFTTVCHKTGKKDPNMEPLRTLKKYRCPKGENNPNFGIHIGLDLPGVVSEGDEVFVTRSASSKRVWF